MRLAAKRLESQGTLLEQIKRIHQQTVQTTDEKNTDRFDRDDACAEIIVCYPGDGSASHQ